MDYDNVVRKFKGYYFLNKRYDKECWEVKKIELSKGQLVVSSISTKQDIENLKTITESMQDTVAPYKFATTKKQFKEFIKMTDLATAKHLLDRRKTPYNSEQAQFGHFGRLKHFVPWCFTVG